MVYEFKTTRILYSLKHGEVQNLVTEGRDKWFEPRSMYELGHYDTTPSLVPRRILCSFKQNVTKLNVWIRSEWRHIWRMMVSLLWTKLWNLWLEVNHQLGHFLNHFLNLNYSKSISWLFVFTPIRVELHHHG